MNNTLHFNRYECLPEYSLVVGLNLDEDDVIFSNLLLILKHP